jgi:hypothetical protein
MNFREARRTDIWAYEMNRFNLPGQTWDYVPIHWQKLWKDPAFLDQLKCRWKELRRSVLFLPNINAKLDTLSRRVALAEPRDHARWPTVIKPPRRPPLFATYKEYVDDLRDWIRKRLAFIDANLPGSCL